MRRATVEESRSINLDYLERHGLLEPGSCFTVNWTNGRGKPTGSAGVWMGEGYVRIVHSWSRDNDEVGEEVDERVLLDQVALGGYRLYFLCPSCGHRARSIHMPPGETGFGCRQCHDLTYRSQQETRTIWSRLFPRQDDRPRRGSNARGYLSALQLAKTADVDELDPGLARLERSIERQNNRWGRPGRPSKRAIKEQRKRDQLQAQGLLDSFGNPTPRPKRGPGRPKEKRAYQRRTPKQRHPVGVGEAYCVRCKDARQLVYAREGILSNGRPALKGRCHACRTRLCRILPGTTMRV